jgi:hypothetical protein
MFGRCIRANRANSRAEGNCGVVTVKPITWSRLVFSLFPSDSSRFTR